MAEAKHLPHETAHGPELMLRSARYKTGSSVAVSIRNHLGRLIPGSQMRGVTGNSGSKPTHPFITNGRDGHFNHCCKDPKRSGPGGWIKVSLSNCHGVDDHPELLRHQHGVGCDTAS